MKNIILLIILLFQPLFPYSVKIKAAYAIGIFDAEGNGENVQHLRKTKADYNGTCHTKVFVLGNTLNQKPKVTIGNSIGHFESSKPIYNSRKIKIGEVFLFKHFAVTKGYIKVSFRGKVYDSKVFVK